MENYILYNDYWKSLFPSKYHKYFFDAINGLYIDKINNDNCWKSFESIYNEIIESKLKANDFFQKKIKDSIFILLKNHHNSNPFQIICKTDINAFLKIILTPELKLFLKKLAKKN